MGSFQFVDGIGADRATKRLIKSHAMKGKNAGRKIHRRSRLEMVRQKLPPPIHAPREDDETAVVITAPPPPDVTLRVSRSLCHVLLTLSCPLALNPGALRIINQWFAYVVDKIYPVHLGFSLDDAHSLWLPMLFTDEGTAHCCITLMEACNGFFLGDGVGTTDALHHLSRSFELMKQRLRTPAALEDSTLAMVLMLIFQEQLRKGEGSTQVHFQGLRRMVELRGGLAQLESNLPLLLKICKTDVTFCLEHGHAPMFFRDRCAEVQDLLASQGFGLDRRAAAVAIENRGIDPFLCAVLLDTMNLAYLCDEMPGVDAFDLVAYQEMLLSIMSRLLRLHSLKSQELMPPTDAAYHIGLIMFMMTIFLQHGHRRMVQYDLVSLRLRSVLESSQHELDDDLSLWLALIGAIWHLRDGQETWLIRRVREWSNQNNIHDWADVQGRLRPFPWLHILHDKLGRIVWDLAQQVA